MSKKRLAPWLPPVTQPNLKKGVQWNHDGTPTLLPLKRHPNDRSLRAEQENYCCDCGLRHVYCYEVFRTPDGNFFLAKRAYRVDEAVVKRKRTRK
jgi:hypothetical protein